MKRCPRCSEIVSPEAITCPHCHKRLKTSAVTKLFVVFFAMFSISIIYFRSQDASGPTQNFTQPTPVARTSAALPTPVSDLDSRLKLVDSVQVRGKTIRVGDLFDDVVSVLKPSDTVGNPIINEDDKLPGSLVIRRTYGVNFDTIRLEGRRSEDPGPYRVSRIWFAPDPR